VVAVFATTLDDIVVAKTATTAPGSFCFFDIRNSLLIPHSDFEIRH